MSLIWFSERWVEWFFESKFEWNLELLWVWILISPLCNFKSSFLESLLNGKVCGGSRTHRIINRWVHLVSIWHLICTGYRFKSESLQKPFYDIFNNFPSLKKMFFFLKKGQITKPPLRPKKSVNKIFCEQQLWIFAAFNLCWRQRKIWSSKLAFHFKSHASASRSDELQENKVAGLCSIRNYEPS